jgi:hypothetical protein
MGGCVASRRFPRLRDLRPSGVMPCLGGTPEEKERK